MSQNNNSTLLKTTLIIYAIVCLVYGIGFVLVPQVLVDLSGGEAAASAWLRWPGAVLIALGIGAIMVNRNPTHQDPFVVTVALGTLLTGLTLLYALFFERAGEFWFTAVPMIINLVISALLWWGRTKSTNILNQAKEG